MPGGPLPIEKGRQIIPYINKLIPKFDLVICTFDWHPKGHSSFGKYGEHCVQNTNGSAPVRELDSVKAKCLLPWFKGFNPKADSTSAFMCENGTSTGLFYAATSSGRPTKVVSLVGVATGICVKDTAMDVLDLFPNLPKSIMKAHGTFPTEIQVHDKGTACLSDESHEIALEEMEQAGITIIR